MRPLAALFALSLALPAVAAPDLRQGDAERLDEYVARFAKHRVEQDVFACAAGGQENFLLPGRGPVVVFFHPSPGAREFRLFYANDPVEDPADMSAYSDATAPTASMFSGVMQRFETQWTRREGWVRVTYLDQGALHVSPPVRIAAGSRPTTFNPQFVTLSWKGGRPEFSWDATLMGGAELYFEVVSDPEKTLLSGTFTEEPRLLFGDPSNVVRHLRPADATAPAPILAPEGRHAFLLMALDADHWVTAISAKLFEPPPPPAD